MLFIRCVLPLMCGAVFLACADAAGPTGPTPATSLSLPGLETEFLPGIPVLEPFAEEVDAAGVVESARGAGHITVLNAARTFAFTAKNMSDGTAQGQFQLNNRAVGVKEHGVVRCLAVDGNQAWVGGVVTHSDGGTEGTARVWRVIDNGEGSNSPGDITSLAFSFGFAAAEQLCQPRTMLPVQAVEDGNIQVTDGGPPGAP